MPAQMDHKFQFSTAMPFCLVSAWFMLGLCLVYAWFMLGLWIQMIQVQRNTESSEGWRLPELQVSDVISVLQPKHPKLSRLGQLYAELDQDIEADG